MSKVSIGGYINSAINFAMQQNYVPIIRSLQITNQTEEELRDLHLKITFEPEFAKEFQYDIAVLEPNKTLEISPVQIALFTEYLFSLTEKIVGTICIEVLEKEEKICEMTHTLELLAYDQWSGLLVMPEMISAFVTPNHPKIAEVLAKASRYLMRWTKNPSFTGYQTRNPNQVKLQMAAIYAALQSAEIVYNNPPASYEVLGQRVRIPHMVLEQKQGTCLDLAVLYTACLEAVGLYPLLVFLKGHAYAGCWLEEETFADCSVDDISSLEKRTVPGSEELLLVECVDYTLGKNIDFDLALEHGKAHLLNADAFSCVIDVQRSRGSGIRPIPVRLDATESTEEDSDANKNQEKRTEEHQEMPSELIRRNMAELSSVEENLTKLKVWERKLLDFSLRNSLLNFRANKSSIQLMAADLSQLEDKLSEGNEFRILEMPSEWVGSLRDSKLYTLENGKDLIQSIASEEFKSNRIRTFLSEEDLTKNLKNIYRAAKVSMEENGTNTLFLALGFLRWYESDISEKPRYAPIVLVPVDIVRSNRNKGYVMRSRQEDAQINITLLEYLRQIFGLRITGLDPLPSDEHGIDLPLVYHTIRKAVMAKRRWNVETMAVVGLFSFGQFVMWNDLRNRSDEIEANKVVSSLIEGKMNWTPKEQTVTLENLDVAIEPDKMAIPMSADSSQMVAIAAAANGQSFVLHGPPGTGKSQTITNMIANALYQGKSVLFVAEKMAALNVVQNRLASIGLEPFCLELHSNKTSKSNVLKQLNQALEVGRIKSPDQYKATADRLYKLRRELNAIIEAIHCKREYGCSLYQAIEKYESYKEEKGKIQLSEELIQQATETNIQTWNEVLNSYIVTLKEVDEFAKSPFRTYEGCEYSIEIRENFERSLRELLNWKETIEKNVLCLQNWTQSQDNVNRTQLDAWIHLGKISAENAPVLKQLVLSSNYEGIQAQIKQVCQDGLTYNQLQAELSNVFEHQVFGYNVNEALLRYKQADMSWFLSKMLGKNKLVKELKLYAKDPAQITAEHLVSYYERILACQDLRQKLENVPTEISKYMGELYLGIATDWNLILQAVNKADVLYEYVKNFSEEKKLAYVDAVSKYQTMPEVEKALDEVRAWTEKIDLFVKKYPISLCELEESTNYLKELYVLFDNFVGHIGQLRNWILMKQKEKQMHEIGLGCVVDAWKSSVVSAETMHDACEGNLYYALILKTIREDVRLKDFQGNQYEAMIAKYSELIERFRVLTIQELVAKLSAQVPANGASSAASSEVGILKRAIKSNGRMLSIRKLFDEIPSLLRRICPCMLMSPISVAQYIDPKFPKFDLVIFDEASQLPTSTAVGTIARGENVVVVGDPNQLPPTSFFSSNRVDEENMEKEDLESLLDDCLSISMPQEHLKWHYRSRHESLIAYSNMKYYENKLYTFPSPNDLVSEVKLIPIEGYYDKGKTKQNKAEAQAVVNEIIRRLQDETLRNDSIGVVTFSSVQQHLIDDMLAEAFAKYPELEDFDRASKEPVFIKNLENVQGDERDVILFSVGYGPDKEGKVSMNFGPLNRDGGWRRLNVAISRARKQMIVYSTIRPEQIDLSRTRSEGVAGLRGFLEFAARGNSALATNTLYASTKKDSLVNQIAENIKALGYEVRCNIGCSAYKMDIGVVDPNHPETYLMGILLDGENCKEAATSKDRFVLQPSVLKGLGWEIMRVWTLEWLDSPEHVLKEIQENLKQKLEEKLEENQTLAQPTDVKKHEEIVFEKIEEAQVEAMSSQKETYQSYEVVSYGTAEAFYEAKTQKKIVQLIERILKAEAPVSRKVLMRKVLSAWGITRAGSKVEMTFDIALQKVKKKETQEFESTFYWRDEQIPEEYQGYRAEDVSGNKRSMDDISCYEITNAIREVLVEQISMKKEDLIKETAKKFGYFRMGSVIETSILNAMEYAVEKQIIVISDEDKVSLA